MYDHKEIQNLREHLVRQIPKEAHAQSSHWQMQLRAFSISKLGERSEFGFGRRIPANSLRGFFHRIGSRVLQKRSGTPIDEEILGFAKLACRKQNRSFDVDVWRHVHTLKFLKDQLTDDISSVVVIGDGQANFSNIFFPTFKSARVVFNVNLPEVLINDLELLSMSLDPLDTHIISLDTFVNYDFSNSKKLMVLCTPTEFLSCTRLEADLFVNIASFQEMSKDWIMSYFTKMRLIKGKKYLYQCNRERKVLPSGEQFILSQLPFNLRDRVIYSQTVPPWHKEFYSWKPPFLRAYEGIHFHSLTKLSN